MGLRRAFQARTGPLGVPVFQANSDNGPDLRPPSFHSCKPNATESGLNKMCPDVKHLGSDYKCHFLAGPSAVLVAPIQFRFAVNGQHSPSIPAWHYNPVDERAHENQKKKS